MRDSRAEERKFGRSQLSFDTGLNPDLRSVFVLQWPWWSATSCLCVLSLYIVPKHYYYYYHQYHHHHRCRRLPCYRLYAGYLQLCTWNYVCWVYSVPAVLYLQFVLHVMLFRPWNMFCTFTLALSTVCAQCPIWLLFFQFCNFLLSRYVAQVLCEWLWNGSIRPSFYRYHFCFHIPRALNFWYGVFIL